MERCRKGRGVSNGAVLDFRRDCQEVGNINTLTNTSHGSGVHALFVKESGPSPGTSFHPRNHVSESGSVVLFVRWFSLEAAPQI